MTGLEDLLRDVGERLTVPDEDLADRVMGRLVALPRPLRPPARTRGEPPSHECPLPHRAAGDE